MRYYTNDTIFHIDIYAAYLVAPNACNRVAGYLHLSDYPTITKPLKLNGAIFVECKTLRHVLSSAAKNEVTGVLQKARLGIPIGNLLHALHHPQLPTPIKNKQFYSNRFHTRQR